MNRNENFESSINSEQQEDSKIEMFFKRIVPDSFCEKKGDTLVIYGAVAFVHNIWKRRIEIIEALENSSFEDITEPKTDSRLTIHAKVKEPKGEISRVEIYVNKDM